jgi:hypothetical protein
VARLTATGSLEGATGCDNRDCRRGGVPHAFLAFPNHVLGVPRADGDLERDAALKAPDEGDDNLGCCPRFCSHWLCKILD